MKKRLIQLITALSILCIIMSGCGKSGGGSPATPAEENLVVKLSAAGIVTALSASYDFTVTVQSKLPAGGVTIKVDVKREDTNAGVYNVLANSTFTTSNFTISPLPPGQIYCTATITVTSVSTATNTWSGSFRVLWK